MSVYSSSGDTTRVAARGRTRTTNTVRENQTLTRIWKDRPVRLLADGTDCAARELLFVGRFVSSGSTENRGGTPHRSQRQMPVQQTNKVGVVGRAENVIHMLSIDIMRKKQTLSKASLRRNRRMCKPAPELCEKTDLKKLTLRLAVLSQQAGFGDEHP